MPSNYKEIEARIPRYEDLLSIEASENNNPFTFLDNDIIPNGYLAPVNDMEEIAGPRVLVREQVKDKLLQAQRNLKTKDENLTLFVTYGYRSLEIQTSRFLHFLKNNVNQFYNNPVDLYNAVHTFIAVPTVAGHPTGGSVDIAIKDERTGEFLDFGSKQYDYSTKDCYVFINTISDQAKNNRMLLRSCMEQSGFAPFEGEWWHFSYGERDWAKHFGKDQTLYSQVAFEEIERELKRTESRSHIK